MSSRGSETYWIIGLENNPDNSARFPRHSPLSRRNPNEPDSKKSQDNPINICLLFCFLKFTESSVMVCSSALFLVGLTIFFFFLFTPSVLFFFGRLFFQPLHIGSNYSLQASQKSFLALSMHSVTSLLK